MVRQDVWMSRQPRAERTDIVTKTQQTILDELNFINARCCEGGLKVGWILLAGDFHYCSELK